MCGRYTQTASAKELRERFGLVASEVSELNPRYNIVPTQDAPVVLEEDGRVLKMFRARAETVALKPSFRTPFRKRRCLVVADGFYEWKRLAGGGKEPRRAVLPSREPFAMAGLWDDWKSPEGKDVRTFTIIATGANDVMKPIHDRMPVIFAREDEATWLDPAAKPDVLASLLKPWSGNLETYAVSPIVNSPRNDNPTCVEETTA
ncbi:MAG: SOS response-associated peptidase [Elusimicrobia bacterium]|nr:SOS response-associated peptidase [Elusimicrobiota bacterium]